MEFITGNNTEVKINVADFISSMKLKKAIQKALLENKIDIASVDFNDIKSGAIDSILELVLTADSNEGVENALFNCLKRCTYNGEKITRDTFEPVEAREDYYEIVVACLKENLSPFFKPLFSKLNGLQEELANSQSNLKQ